MDILFWSGGKDAYLALKFYQQAHEEAGIKLLTTYDESSDIFPHQDIALEDIKMQAKRLNLELITVSLPTDASNEVYLKRIKETLRQIKQPVEHLIFGDWHLEDIRKWRKKVFSEMGYSCVFPIWGKNIHDLLPVLFLNPVTIKINAVKQEFRSLIQPREVFDQKFVTQLQYLSMDIDPMGEYGEFHTKVIFDI